jgi:hypothetical protein
MDYVPQNNGVASATQTYSRRKLDELVPVRLSRWAFWRAPIYVSLSWLHEQANLADQEAEIEFRKVALASELKKIQQRAGFDKKMAKGNRWVKVIDWASRPSKRNQPQMIPGIGLELCVISAFVSLGVANLIM